MKNAKGDVLGLSDASGKLVAEYEYDSWGNITKSETLDTSLGANFAKTNPRLYASYWYDQDLTDLLLTFQINFPEKPLYYSQEKNYNNSRKENHGSRKKQRGGDYR